MIRPMDVFRDFEFGPVAHAPGLPKVDYCVVFSGANAVRLAQVYFGSLRRTTDTTGVTFHLVNRGVPDEDFARIVAMAPECKTYERPPIPAQTLAAAAKRLRPLDENDMGLDVEWTCNWVVENCGTEKFVVLSHFDLCFKDDFLNFLRGKVTDRTGILGHHAPFMLLNREAFRESVLKFHADGGPFYAVVREDAPSHFWLRYHGDPRVGGRVFETGFDSGELLELELRARGWHCDPLKEHFDEYFYHFWGGAYKTDGHPDFASIVADADWLINRYGFPEKSRG